jgi:hypothetical protein
MSKEAPLRWICWLQGSLPQFELSGKVFYLRLHEHWSHLIHRIKGISTHTGYPLLRGKAAVSTPASHPSPSLRTAQIFSTLQLTNWA